MKNVYSQLSDFEIELEKKLTIAYPGYWFSPKFKKKIWDGHHHFLKVPELKVPTGLLFMVKEFFDEHDIKYEIIDERSKPQIGEFSRKIDDILAGITLWDFQIEAICNALNLGRGVLELPTGSGKTEIALGIISLLKRKTLFIVHTKDLLHQTHARATERLIHRPGESPDIGLIGDSEKLFGDHLDIALIQSLNSMFTRDKSFLKKLLNSYEVVFFDECHHSSASTWYRLGMYMHNAYYRFGLSGTALRRDLLSNMRVMALTGDAIYKKKTTELIDDGRLSNIEIHIVENNEIVHGRNWQEIYEKGIVKSRARNVSITDIAHKAWLDRRRVMILVRRIDHGKILEKELVDSLNTPAIFVHGSHESHERDEAKKEFDKEGDFILIASPIFDEGVDLPKINTLIIAAGGKSEWKVVQQIGRGLRKFGDETLEVYDFLDSSKFLAKHSEERIKIYKREGFLE